MSADSQARASGTEPDEAKEERRRDKNRKDDQIRSRLTDADRIQWSVAVWADQKGDVRMCGMNIPNREEIIQNMMESMQKGPSEPPTDVFLAPEDVFWGGKLTQKQFVQLVRVLDFNALRKDFLEGKTPEHMEKYKGKSARCIDFPTSQGHGAYGALWNSVSEEHKTKWKQDIPELLTMSAWKDDPSQLEIVNDRRLIKFDDLMQRTNELSKFRLSELVACIAIWLHWHDEDHYKRTSPSQKLIDQWTRISASRPMNEFSTNTQLADDRTQSAIKNGILFPIWKMKGCPCNDSTPFKRPVRNKTVSIQWLDVPGRGKSSSGGSSSSKGIEANPPPPPLDDTVHTQQMRNTSLSQKCAAQDQEIRQLKEQARIRDQEMTGLREKMERAQSESSRVNQQCEDLTSRMTSKTEEINTLLREKEALTQKVHNFANRTKKRKTPPATSSHDSSSSKAKQKRAVKTSTSNSSHSATNSRGPSSSSASNSAKSISTPTPAYSEPSADNRMLPSPGKTKFVAVWKIKPTYFALIATKHPRWKCNNVNLQHARNFGYFKGAKTSEGRSLSGVNKQRQAGDIVKLECSGKLDWLDLRKGDYMTIVLDTPHHFKTWSELVSASNVSTLLPWNRTKAGAPRNCNMSHDSAVKEYERMYYHETLRGEGAGRFDFELVS